MIILALLSIPPAPTEALIDAMLLRSGHRVRGARKGRAAWSEKRWQRAVARRIGVTQAERDGRPLPEARADDACMQAARVAAGDHRPRAFLRHCAKRAGKGMPGRHRTHTGRAMDPVWNRPLQRLFIEGLRRLGNVRAVARILGVHNSTFYRQRRLRPDFAWQWRRAMDEFYDDLERKLVDRAANGWREDVWYAGACVGTRTVYDHRLGIQLLELRRRKSRDAVADQRLAVQEEAAALAAAQATQAANAPRRGRLAAPLSHEDDDPWQNEEELSPRHSLFLDLMNRHRERRPDEWDGDRHLESEFDFRDWRTWLKAKVEKRLAEMGDESADYVWDETVFPGEERCGEARAE